MRGGIGPSILSARMSLGCGWYAGEFELLMLKICAKIKMLIYLAGEESGGQINSPIYFY